MKAKKESNPKEMDREALKMNLFFAELNILAVSIIGGTTRRSSTGNNAKCYVQDRKAKRKQHAGLTE